MQLKRNWRGNLDIKPRVCRRENSICIILHDLLHIYYTRYSLRIFLKIIYSVRDRLQWGFWMHWIHFSSYFARSSTSTKPIVIFQHEILLESTRFRRNSFNLLPIISVETMTKLFSKIYNLGVIYQKVAKMDKKRNYWNRWAWWL